MATKKKQIYNAQPGTTITTGDGTFNVLAVANMLEVRGNPPEVQGSDPYRFLGLSGNHILVHIRERDQGDYAWFLLKLAAGAETEPLKPHASRLGKAQSTTFDFEFQSQSYRAMDVGGIECALLHGDGGVLPVQHESHAMYFLAWTEKRALLWFAPMRGLGGAKNVVYVGVRIENIEEFVTEVVS